MVPLKGTKMESLCRAKNAQKTGLIPSYDGRQRTWTNAGHTTTRPWTSTQSSTSLVTALLQLCHIVTFVKDGPRRIERCFANTPITHANAFLFLVSVWNFYQVSFFHQMHFPILIL